MKKKIIALFVAVIMVLSTAAPVFAAEDNLTSHSSLNVTVSKNRHHLQDIRSEPFTNKQANSINEKAKEIYTNYGVDIFIVISDTYATIEEAEKASKKLYNSAYTDAAFVVISSGNQFDIYPFGRAVNIIDGERLYNIGEKALKQKKYIDRYNVFLKLIDNDLKSKGVQPIPDKRLLPRLVDNADLLSESEEIDLLAKLDEISERQRVDVAVATVNSLEGKTATAYADDFYDYNGYGMGRDRNGIILVIAMDEREWAISTCGSCIAMFTDAGQEYIVDQFKPDLSNGNYADAFNTFADLCDDYITQAKEGVPYDSGDMPKEDFPFFQNILISLGAGVFIALIVVAVMSSQLKSVRTQKSAANYTVPHSLRLTQNQDLYLYHVVTKTARPDDDDSSSGGGGGGSSSHSSSSGSSHGGSSGSF